MFQRIEQAQNTSTVNQASIAWLKWLELDNHNYESDIVTYREFYEGIHGVPLSDRQKEYLEKNGVDFRVNYLKLAIDLMVERFCVEGFDSESDVYSGKDGLFSKWWQAARMDGIQKALHKAAAVDGDTYLLCEWDSDKNRPNFYHERAYDGVEGVRVTYQDASRRNALFATKRWRESSPDVGTVMKMNIYTVDAVYKYEADGKAAYGWRLLEELPWAIDSLPIVHFRYDDDGSNWGKSELDTLIPLQEALNKSVLDLLDTSDNSAFQLITLAGGEVADDFTLAPRQVLYHHSEQAKWGHIPAGDIEKLQGLKNDFIITIAQLAQIPLNYFQVTGQVASAETQGANDSGLVSKAESMAVSLGNSWEDAMILAAKMHRQYGTGSVELDNISTQWASFERVDKLEKEGKRAAIVEALTAAGASLEGALMAAGYNDEMVQLLMRGDTVDNIEQ